MTLLLSRLREYDLLSGAYRSYLSTHLESGAVWYLLSLSLLAGGRLDEAFLAIRECLTRCSDDVHALMSAAQISLRMRKGKESVEYASRALRNCKQQIAHRTAQLAIEAQIAAADAAGSSPNTITSLTADLAAANAAVAKSSSVHSSSALSFLPLIHHGQIQSSLLATCQLLFGVSCSRYAYQVSTFSNRKSLQKRALHALEHAYNHEFALCGAVSNKRLVFALATLYADIREIARAIALTKRALELDRYDVHHWNLLALLLSSQKKYRSALLACEQGLMLVGKDASAVPLLLTRAKLQSHLGLYDDAVTGLADVVRLLFPTASFHLRSYVAAGASRVRATFRPARKAESTEKSENARMDQATCGASSDALDRASTQVETLLTLSRIYAAQSATTTQLGGATKDESWLNDAFDAVHFAREIAPTQFLPTIHASLASLAAQAGSSALAVRHFESALVLDAHHTGALVGLAQIETSRIGSGGNLVLAYGYLMSALQVDATDHAAWYEMGVILQAQGKCSAAAEHFTTAVELERTAPIDTFRTIPRTVA